MASCKSNIAAEVSEMLTLTRVGKSSSAVLPYLLFRNSLSDISQVQLLLHISSPRADYEEDQRLPKAYARTRQAAYRE